MKKKLAIIIPAAVVVLAVLAVLLYANSMSLSISKGICLVADNGSYLLIDEQGPIQMSNSDRTEIFGGLKTGDEILVLHDGIMESYPARTVVYHLVKTGEDKEKQIPQQTVDSLIELGWLEKPTHKHELAEVPQTNNENDIGGYCGNTVTKVTVDGKTYEFMFGESVTLTDMLLKLDYDPAKLCKCRGKYIVDTEFGLGYEINLEQGYARYNGGQASLTQKQVDTVADIMSRLEKIDGKTYE